MGHSIDISQLKNNGNSTIAEEKPKNPNDTASKNIDGQAVRDFGGGLKEFDPKANGFEPVKIERKPNDKDRALQAFDKQMESRREEVEKYNELLDQYGGQISEEELRAEMGKDHVTQMLHDGAGDIHEDAPGENVNVNKTVNAGEMNDTETSTDEVSDELRALEEELESDDIGGTMNQESEQNTFVDPNIAKLKASQQIAADPAPIIDKESAPVAKSVDEYIKDKTPEAEEKVPVQPSTTYEESHKVDASTSEASGVVPIEVAEAPKQTDMSEEDKDLKALDDDESSEPTDDFDEKLKAELAKKMRPVSKKFDLSSAVVSTVPVTVTNALKDVIPLDRKIFTWGLYKSKRPVTVKAFTATELNSLSSYMNNRNRSRDVFKALWDHIVRGKGKDFDSWLKTTSYYDVDNLWFAVYGACFSETNYLPYTCQSCQEVTVSADIPIDQMCKFQNDDIKKEFYDIINGPNDPDMGAKFAEYRVQVSDSIVVGLREPSIYDAVIVPTLFDAEFNEKYRDIVGLNAYIANIYKIIVNNNRVELHPIAVKQFIGNETKTAKARIIQYAKIIRSLTSDQYNIIMGHINTLNETDSIYYKLPSISCDHCKKEIPEEREAAADLVFMRHRLAILGV